MFRLKGQHHFASSHPCYTPLVITGAGPVGQCPLDACLRGELNGAEQSRVFIDQSQVELCRLKCDFWCLGVSSRQGAMSSTRFEWSDALENSACLLRLEKGIRDVEATG